MSEYINKIITLSNGEQIVIIETLDYEGKQYALTNEIVDNKLGTNLTIYRIDNINSETNFVVEKDSDILQAVLLKLSN